MFIQDEIAVVAFKNEAEFQAFIELGIFEEVGNHIPVGVPSYSVLPPPEDTVMTTAQDFREVEEEIIIEPEVLADVPLSGNLVDESKSIIINDGPCMVEEVESTSIDGDVQDVQDVQGYDRALAPEEVSKIFDGEPEVELESKVELEPEKNEVADFAHEIEEALSDGILDKEEVDSLLIDAAEAIAERMGEQKEPPFLGLGHDKTADESEKVD
jgi:hypothetical protein